jgi:hypothetical protein
MATEEKHGAQQTKDKRRKKQWNVDRRRRQALGVVTVFGLDFLFFFHVTLFHRF